MLASVLSGIVLALLAPALARVARTAAGCLLAMLPAGLTVYFLSLIGPTGAGSPTRESYLWVPSLGVTLSFYADSLALLFALLITGIGALVFIYAGGYLAGHHHLGRFYSYLLLFMASMLGVVLADNVITLFVFWELTSLSSYLLIGFNHERTAARSAALQALLVTGLGGLALLAGLLLLGHAGGTMELSQLSERADAVRGHALYLPILLLILAGAFTKSAQFPFHFWLPSAMEAPTPVSAYLHSATMVKAGVYLLARLSPVLGGTDLWKLLLMPVGAATLLVGSVLALCQTDLKLLLAYSTVAALGVLVLLLGIGTTAAAHAVVVYLLAHACYKGTLFLVAGAVDHEAGTRDVTRLAGLFRVMPITALAAGLAALSMAGVPPFLGFIAKELLLEATLAGPAALGVTAAAVTGGALLVTAAAMVGVAPFLGQPITPRPAHEAAWSLWIGPLLLAGGGLSLGLWPGSIDRALLGSAASALRGDAAAMKLALWHGWTLMLALSAVTLGCGVVLFVNRTMLSSLGLIIEPAGRWGPARWYALALDGLHKLARLQTRLLQSGYLRYYLLSVLVVLVLLAILTGVRYGPEVFAYGLGRPDHTDIRFYEAGLAVMIVAASLMSVLSRSRFAAIGGLGMVGYAVALLFVLFGAPDLAMTQFLIETLTVILFVLVFYHLPGFARLSSGASRLRDGIVALTVGALMTVLVLVTGRVQMHEPISRYYADQSQPAAHGRNIVNVILVDFRALDTLGEISVLALAGIGVYALLKLRPAKQESP
jgi:multicomponent Na+:H+ antiporter subunit A